MRRPHDRQSSDRPAIPAGWVPVNALQHGKKAKGDDHDRLGLAKPANPIHVRMPRIAGNNPEDASSVRSSPRHRRLQERLQGASPSTPSCAVADAFAPNRSLRSATLQPVGRPISSPNETMVAGVVPRPACENPPASSPSPLLRQANFLNDPPRMLPLHETVQTFDIAVDASPHAESNQVAITELFLIEWMERFERDRPLYKSIAVHAEIAFRELYRLTANIALPNDVITKFAARICEDMTGHFGPFALIMKVLNSELRQAIYAPPQFPESLESFPYFAIVKNQKRVLLSLHQDMLRRQERNDFLRYEIDKVHQTFLHFLDQCSFGLVRTILHEWYSVSVTSKRNSKKYIEYFSGWFGGSAKALAPRIFLAWKHNTTETKVLRLHDQWSRDREKVSLLQKQIDDLIVQRDHAQLESLAIRNDRKQADDTIQRLQRKIQSATVFLEGTHRREGIVAQEGQLRVEAVTFLPPLVLESLLRGFHRVGFLQPLHEEFTPTSSTRAAESKQEGHDPRLSDELPIARSTVRNCIATVLRQPWAQHDANRTEKDNTEDQKHSPSPVSVDECLARFRAIISRIELDPTAHLLFLSKADGGKIYKMTTAVQPQHDWDDGDTTRMLDHVVERLFRILRNVRHQDEHYARHFKLFGSRLLEQSEVSVVPPTRMAPHPSLSDGNALEESIERIPALHMTSDLGVINGMKRFSAPSVEVGSLSLTESETKGSASTLESEGFSLLRPLDASCSPQFMETLLLLSLSQLISEYGSLLFSPTDMTPFVRNRMLQRVMLRGIAGGKHTFKMIIDKERNQEVVSVEGETEMSSDDGSNDDDEDESIDGSTMDLGVKQQPEPSSLHSQHQSEHRRVVVASRRTSSYKGPHASIARDIEHGLSQLVTAYDVWNRLSKQLVDANIVHSRGGFLSDGTAHDPASGETGSVGSPSSSSQSLTNDPSKQRLLSVQNDPLPTSFVALRPRLHAHTEPLPTGALMTAVRDKDRTDAPTTPGGMRRRSLSPLASSDWSYDSSKIRHLPMEDTQQLSYTIHGVHETMRIASERRVNDFIMAKQQMRGLHVSQWFQACDLASHFTMISPSVVSADAQARTSMLLDDDRRHLHECVLSEHDAIERLFSVESQPAEERERVAHILERKKHIVHHSLYSKHRPGVVYAATLEDLWHVVKVLRLPRDVKVLPTIRDEDLIGSSYYHEQHFSPDDLLEVVLQLCNEQFLPQVTPLSARVEHFVIHYLPFALQNQNAMRDIMPKADVKKALSDHGQTLRTIFRRYCAKDKDLVAAAVAKRRAAVISTSGSSSGSGTSSSTQGATATAVGGSSSVVQYAHPPHGVSKFMRISDWHEFISDYKLLRARFNAEYATTVFRNVQEAESGQDDHLEMIYSEFCEAVVAIAVCFFPDPFLKHSTRVNQFIRRYLPVSPEDIRDLHV